jgi:hypothetical protein
MQSDALAKSENITLPCILSLRACTILLVNLYKALSVERLFLNPDCSSVRIPLKRFRNQVLSQ